MTYLIRFTYRVRRYFSVSALLRRLGLTGGLDAAVPVEPMTTSVEETVSSRESVNRHWQRNLMVCVFGSFTTLVAMTVMLPFLPLYVEELGVHGHAAIVQWSGIAYSAAFFTAALVAPLGPLSRCGFASYSSVGSIVTVGRLASVG